MGNQSTMGNVAVNELMDDVEQRAEERLKLLHVLDTARMMRVTREAIVAWIEAERRKEREAFGALGREPVSWHEP